METWTAGKIDLEPWRQIPAELEALGLTIDDVTTKVWFLENGRLFSAAEAVNRSMRYAWWAVPLAYAYYLPGLRQLEEHIYRWIAANRHRMPGSTDACALPEQEA